MGIPLRIVETSTDEEREPGMMWRCLDGGKEGLECWWIVLPNTRNDGTKVSWRTTDVASSPPHGMRDVTGTPPNLTVNPSIDVEYWRTVDGQPVRDGSYWHGWIKERVISPA